jgi:hypothetical protein
MGYTTCGHQGHSGKDPLMGKRIMKKTLTMICCSVLKKELEAVLNMKYQDSEKIFLDSMLHMRPDKLHRAMKHVISDRSDKPCLIVYGDCHAYMKEMEHRPHCARTAGKNCGELLLGKEQYKACREEKAFLFLPEWTNRWKEIFQHQLGFSDPALAREFMQENMTHLVYLNTGLVPIPEKTILDISDFFGMPVTIMETPLTHLALAVESALKRVEGITPDEC